MQLVSRKVTASAMTTVALMMVAACDRSLEPTVRRFNRDAASLATAVDASQLTHITLPQDADGNYLLSRVCDVFIGEPVIDPIDGAPQRYDHQVIVDVPVGARIKLVGTEAMGSSKLFTCDAVDRNPDGTPILDANGQEQPVIDPVTLHAAKGDGPLVTTNGVTLDLNGYSITVSPEMDIAAGFENIGVVLAGSGQTLTNSSTQVSKIYGFGHNIDIEADNPTVQGRRFAADGVTPDIAGPIFNIETRGGMGIRLSTGTMTIDQVKSVNNDDPIDGQGFEARRISSGFLTVSNSHFEGGGEGAFLREVSGVTFTNNFVASSNGPAIVTRQARSLAGRAILITDNVVGDGTTGIFWGRESTSSGNLRITGNILLNSGCSIGLSSRNALSSISPYSLTSTATNFIGNVNFRNAARTVKATTCRVGD